MKQFLNEMWDTYWPLVFTIIMISGSLALIALATTVPWSP